MPRPSSKEFANYDAVAQELKKHIPNYDKTEAFFNKTHIYQCLKVVADVLNLVSLRPLSCNVSWLNEEKCVLLQRG